jgi:hypothetical protein
LTACAAISSAFCAVLICVAHFMSLQFLGIKYILYYMIFYGLGWLLKQTKSLWMFILPELKNSLIFICFILFLAIVFNYDLYRCEDNLISIILRFIAGLTGNVIVFWFANKYQNLFLQVHLEKIGQYTLEIYVTHVNVASLFSDNSNSFFTGAGFGNFIASLLCTILFSTLVPDPMDRF